MGCFDLEDGSGNPLLPVQLEDDPLNTPKTCSARCKQQGYLYAGVTGSVGCRCGNLEPWDAVKKSEVDCGLP